MSLSLYFIGKKATPDYRQEFSRIARLQESGNLDDAVRQYKDLHARYGIESCSLYYNLGNAYFRLDQPGRALQYYRKALRLKPGDRQVRHNIRHVEAMLNVDNPPSAEERSAGSRLLFKVLNAYSIYGWTVISVANYWRFTIGILLLVFFGAKRKFFVYLALVLGIVFVLGLGLTAARAWLDLSVREGVALERLAAMFEPDEGGETAFMIREGTVLRIDTTHREWYQVRLRTGEIGWVKIRSVGEI
jgi:tetratricopeptide (TPR) repeat protein